MIYVNMFSKSLIFARLIINSGIFLRCINIVSYAWTEASISLTSSMSDASPVSVEAVGEPRSTLRKLSPSYS